MERLTNRNQEIPLPSSENASFWANVHEQLARYEDAEEEGRLVILPCKIGSEVFALWFGSVVPASVIGFHFYEWKEGYSVRVLFDTRKISGARDLSFDAFGKTLFFTREEAEAALKGGNDVRTV